MKVKEAKTRIANIENCIQVIENRQKKGKEPFFVDSGKCTINFLRGYKHVLLELIDNAELNTIN